MLELLEFAADLMGDDTTQPWQSGRLHCKSSRQPPSPGLVKTIKITTSAIDMMQVPRGARDNKAERRI